MNQFPSIDNLPDFPDVEDLFVTYVERFGHADTVYPKADKFEKAIKDSGAVIVCQRAGGGADEKGRDTAPVIVAVTARSRSASWAVMNKIRRAVVVAANGVTVDGILLDSMSEAGDLQMMPSLNPDTREVQLTFLVTCRRPRRP